MRTERRLHRTLLHALAGALWCIVVGLAGPVSAQSSASDPATGDDDAPDVIELTEVAERLYARGVQHFELDEFDEAAVLFEEAYRYDPTPRLAYNVGRAWHHADNEAVARVWYEIAMGSDDPELLERIANAMAQLDAAEVATDDDAATTSTDAPRGRRSATAPGGEPPPRPPGHTRRVVGVTLVGVGAATLVAGAATGATARDRHDAASRTDDPAAFDRLVDEGRSARSTSMALWGTSLALVGVGGALIAIPAGSGAEVDVASTGRGARLRVRF